MKNIILDMDGTLANFYEESNCLEQMHEKGFFRGLKPYPIVKAVNRLLLEHEDRLFILSACLTQEGRAEKRAWLREYLPNLLVDNIIFCDVGENKSDYVNLEFITKSILVDDYSRNLLDWRDAGGMIIKARNQINGQGFKVAETVDVYDSYRCYLILKNLIED